MLYDLIQSFVLGFAISATPGAVFFETIRRTIAKNNTVLSFLVGNFIGIIVVITIAFFGISIFVTELVVKNSFYITSGLILLFIGISSIVTKPHANAETSHRRLTIRNIHLRAFFIGLTLSIANPVSIIFWITLMGTFVSNSDYFAVILNALAVIIGALVLFLSLVFTISKMKVRLSDTFLLWMTRFFGGIIIVYGIIIIIKPFSG